MKTLFNGKGKLWLTVLITLCAVVSACAAFVCLFSSENKNVETASATPYKSTNVISASCDYECGGGHTITVSATRSTFDIYVAIPSEVYEKISSCYVTYEDSGDNLHCLDCKGARYSASWTYGDDDYISIHFSHNRATVSGEHNLAIIFNGDTNTEYCVCLISETASYNPGLQYCPVPTLSTTSAAYSPTSSTYISVNCGCGDLLDYTSYSLPSGWNMANWNYIRRVVDIVIPKGTPVGDYTVRFYCDGDAADYFRDGSTEKIYTITIKKKGIAVPTLSKGSGVASSATVSGQTATTSYTGSAQHFTISSTDCINFSTTTSGSTRNDKDFYATEVNTSGYVVNMVLLDKTNYCWGSNGGTDIGMKTLTIVINRAGITRPSAAAKTYNGLNQTLISNFDSSKMTATYKYTPYNSTDATAVGTATATTSVSYKNAGTYVFTFTPKGNYQWSSGSNVTSSTGDISVTLGQATLTPSSTISSKAYNGNTTGSGTISLTGAVNNEKPTATGTFTWTSANGGTSTYNVTNIALGAGWRNNYKLSATSLSNKSNSGVTITKASQSKPTITATTTTVACDESITLTSSGQGTLTWTVTTTADNGAVDKTTGTGTSFTIKGTHWGTVSVSVKAGGNDNYIASDSSDAKSITVQRKAIAIPTLAKGSGADSGATVSGQTATTTYTGSAQHFTISSTTNITFGTPSKGATRTNADFYATDANTGYTVSMSINGDKYCWGDSNGGTDVENKTLKIVIDKADLTVTANAKDGTYYIGDALSTVTIEGSAKFNSAAVEGSFDWVNGSTVLTASGNYSFKFTPTSSNYNEYNGEITVTAVVYFTLTISGVKTTYVAFESFVYNTITVIVTDADGKQKPLSLSDYDISLPYDEEVGHFLYKDNGSKVVFSYEEGGNIVTEEYTITVNKATYNMESAKWQYEGAFTYDGTAHEVEVVGLPEGVTATYKENSKISAGKYTAVATLDYDNENYNEISLDDCKWEIKKATLDMSEAAWNYKEAFTYDGTTHTVEVTGLPTNVTPEYTDNSYKNAGKYTATVTFSYDKDNYEEISLDDLDWEIKKATLDMSEAAWNYEEAFTYDGTTHTVEVEGLPEGVTPEYTNNSYKNAGSYTATVTFSYDKDNYEEISLDDLDWVIEKASVGTITFEDDDSVIYDGETHYITIKETLPEEVKVEYFLAGLSSKFDGAKDVKIVGGEVAGYTVTAKFSCDTGNYIVPKPMDAVLTINPRVIKDEDVSGIEVSYVYTGENQTPAPVVKLTLTDGGEEITLSSSKDYKVTYEGDNLNADNTVEVTVKGTGNYGGSVTTSFTITKKTLNVIWQGDEKYTYNGENQGVYAVLDGVVPNDLGKIELKYTYSSRGATDFDDSSDKPVEVGHYSLSVILKEEYTNYESFETQVKNFQIEQAEIAVSIEFDGYNPDNDQLYMGGTLPDIKLVSATFNGNAVDGKLSWVSTSLSEKATDTYEWQYAPTDTRNFKTYTGTVSLNATRAPIVKLVASFNDDAPEEIYVTTSLETLKNYITVTGYFADDETSTEIKGYSLTSSRFDETPSIADVYELDISYNGIDCTLEVEYKPVTVTKITVTARDPEAGIKTAYEGYDVFDRTSVIVTAERNDGYVWELSDNEYTVEYAIKGNDFFCVGETYVTISYGTGADRKAEEIAVSVSRKEFDLAGISFEDDKVTYDGTVHNAAIVGMFGKGTIDYEYWKDGVRVNVNEGVRDAGEYTVKAVFNFTDATDKKNYKPVTLEKNFVIEKAVYSNVKFKDLTADYNLGKSLGGLVKLEGLPEGDEVKLTYTVTNKTTGETLSSLDEIKNAGTYEITVAFTVDGNHEPLNSKTATLVVNKLKPQVDPKWRGNLTQGTQLSKVLLEAGENEVPGTYEWKAPDYELQVGLNRCSYVFTPEDTVNYEVVTSYMDLTVVGAASEPQPQTGGTLTTGLTVAIIIGMAVCLLVALIALIIASKKPKTEDSDGFYDAVTEADLQ